MPWKHMGEWRHTSIILDSLVSFKPSPHRFTPGTHWTGVSVDPRAGLDAVEYRKISCPSRESNLSRPARRLSLFRLRYPSICIIIRNPCSFKHDYYVWQRPSPEVFFSHITFQRLHLFPSSGVREEGFLLSWARYRELVRITEWVIETTLSYGPNWDWIFPTLYLMTQTYNFRKKLFLKKLKKIDNAQSYSHVYCYIQKHSDLTF
jgi:hypothetical protein